MEFSTFTRTYYYCYYLYINLYIIGSLKKGNYHKGGIKMKFTCNKEVLLKEVSIAQEIIASKNAILILSNIYLEANNNILIIKAKDLKVNFQTEVPVTVIESGSTTVYGDKFFGVISTFP